MKFMKFDVDAPRQALVHGFERHARPTNQETDHHDEKMRSTIKVCIFRLFKGRVARKRFLCF